MKYISRTVWILSLISLFTDAASEMLYPVLPIYLESIGFSVLFIGVLEGIAEATSGLSKGYFGNLSDSVGKRIPFVQFGYLLSSISRPLIVLFSVPIWVLFARILDRLGKGIRTGARDAILSEESTNGNKASVFGFHRSMDTLGAVIGPSIALIYLYFYPGNYKTIFIIAFIPGVLSIITSLFLKESSSLKGKIAKKKIGFFSFLFYWKSSDIHYKKLVVGLLLFALINSSDVFLLLKAKESGMSEVFVIGLYIFYNLIYAIFAFPLGRIADKMGIKTIYITGLICFSMAYFGIALSNSKVEFLLCFIIYGIFSAATEGISKAWLTSIVTKENTGTAIGFYTGFQSICTLLASSLTGIIWYTFGGQNTLIFIAVCSLFIAFYFLRLNIRKNLF